MPETAAAQLRRILHLIPQLADGEPHALHEVAEKAGVPEKTVLRDLQSISERFEVPGGFVEGLQIYIAREGVSVHSNHLLRPMRLTRGELCALELGLTMLRRERTPEEHGAIDGAVGRLRDAIVKLPADDVGDAVSAALPVPPGRLDHLRAIREAQREHRKVRLHYRRGGEQEAAQRIICPHAIAFAHGMWYVVAHCESSGGVRFFRLDRMEQVQPLDIRFEPVEQAEVEPIVREGRAFQSDGGREAGDQVLAPDRALDRGPGREEPGTRWLADAGASARRCRLGRAARAAVRPRCRRDRAGKRAGSGSGSAPGDRRLSVSR